MTKIVSAIGRGILFTAAILALVALACFAIGVSLVAYPYRKANKGNFSAFMDLAMAGGQFLAASGFLMQAAKKQPETRSPETPTQETNIGHNG